MKLATALAPHNPGWFQYPLWIEAGGSPALLSVLDISNEFQYPLRIEAGGSSHLQYTVGVAGQFQYPLRIEAGGSEAAMKPVS